MIVFLLAALLQAASPAPAESAKADNGLPKDDYRLVAWCHGALAGQLELDDLAHADMEKIEGKAKVAERAKADAELEKERRKYLKDYERALAAAETASPTMIHAKGVAAEQQGYRMWAATRNKEPIWRMLDWGMWDPNDAGCSEAAQRLLEKSQLMGAALKGGDTLSDAAPAAGAASALDAKDDKAAGEGKPADAAAPKPDESRPGEAKAEESKAEAPKAGEPDQGAPPPATVGTPPPAPDPMASADGPAEAKPGEAKAADAAPSQPEPAKSVAKVAKTKTKPPKPKRKSAEEVRAAIAAEAPKPAAPEPGPADPPPPEPKPSEPKPPGDLRGPYAR